MDLNEKAAAALAECVSILELSCSAQGNEVVFTDLPLRLRAEEAQVIQGPGGCATPVMFCGDLPGAPASVRVLTVGRGKTPEEGLRDAVMQWTLGVFQCLISCTDPNFHTCMAQKKPLTVTDSKAGETRGWTVYCSPVLTRGGQQHQGRPGSSGMRDCYLDVMSPVTKPILSPGQIYWIESYLHRMPDRTVDATCRLNNLDWLPGRDALLACARQFPVEKGGLVAQRQFLLFQPTPLDQLPVLDQHPIEEESAPSAAVRPVARRPWWKSLLGG